MEMTRQELKNHIIRIVEYSETISSYWGTPVTTLDPKAPEFIAAKKKDDKWKKEAGMLLNNEFQALCDALGIVE